MAVEFKRIAAAVRVNGVLVPIPEGEAAPPPPPEPDGGNEPT